MYGCMRFSSAACFVLFFCLLILWLLLSDWFVFFPLRTANAKEPVRHPVTGVLQINHAYVFVYCVIVLFLGVWAGGSGQILYVCVCFL